jgi:hypothetical protein
MSLKEFSATIQSQIYKKWFDKLEKNIINSSAESLRTTEQSAEKTSFYITEATVRDMYKTITGKKLESDEVQLFMRELIKPMSGKSGALSGSTIKVNGKPAAFFKNIGFDTITTKLTTLLNSYPDVEHAYKEAEDNYIENKTAELLKSPEYKKMKLAEKKKAIAEIEKKGKERATFGYYFNKGHVISIATNLSKKFRQEIEKADEFSATQRAALLEVLDNYISKLQQDDLATANLPNAVDQELYAGYTKSSDSYLVEIQHKAGNLESGSASKAIVEEMRGLFNMSTKDITSLLSNSPSLNSALVKTEGSPSFLQLIIQDVLNSIAGKAKKKQVYAQAPVLVAKKTNKISKPKRKTAEIAKAKRLRNKLAAVKKDPESKRFVQLADTKGVDTLVSLQTILDALLAQKVKDNMGDGSRRDVLNLRTGRLAESAKVERLSESRAGMITAFYTYMKNPYATFSSGGRQQMPRSRDPKALISKSIREIAATQVGNRLRAVLV